MAFTEYVQSTIGLASVISRLLTRALLNFNVTSPSCKTVNLKFAKLLPNCKESFIPLEDVIPSIASAAPSIATMQVNFVALGFVARFALMVMMSPTLQSGTVIYRLLALKERRSLCLVVTTSPTYTLSAPNVKLSPSVIGNGVLASSIISSLFNF